MELVKATLVAQDLGSSQWNITQLCFLISKTKEQEGFLGYGKITQCTSSYKKLAKKQVTCYVNNNIVIVKITKANHTILQYYATENDFLIKQIC